MTCTVLSNNRQLFLHLYMFITRLVSLLSASSECKLNFQSRIEDLCQCCSIKHYAFFQCSKHDFYIGYDNYSICLTWNNATQNVEVSHCLFIPKDSSSLSCEDDFAYYKINLKFDNTLLELTNVTCGVYNREGPRCKQCIHGYGPAAFSDGVTCADCSKHKHMWILNLLFQLAMVTLMYIAVVLLQIKGTSSPFNIIMAYGQILTNSVMIGSTYIELTCFTSKNITILFLTIFGVLNLDFLRFVIPPLCISASLKSITVLLFDYIIALYPIFLTALLYICIELHDRNYKLIICLVYPFRYLRHRNWNPKETILNTCASFLLLSYSKFLFVSCSLLLSVNIYNCDSKIISNHTVLFYDPAVTFLDSEHIPYAILALFVILIFVVLPPLLLLLYPTRLFRKCLSCCGFQRWDILHFIMDIFQGWYKDGTEGTYDYRSLSSLYMLLRITFAASYVSILLGLSEIHVKIFLGVLHFFLGMILLAAKPYKKNWMSHVDGGIFLFCGILILTTHFQNKVLFVIESLLILSILLLSGLFILFRCFQNIFI